ncbi:MAG: hypothetical protein AB7H43_00065 [Acidimicrobiia bacterium]
MADASLEDHAGGIELQMIEITEQLERATVQGRSEDVAALEATLRELADELARTAEALARPVPPSRIDP